MWLLLNNIDYSSSLSVRKSLVHGVPARVGQINTFSIFVTCEDITSEHGYTCSVNLTDPNGQQAGNYVLEATGKTFNLIEGETVQSASPFVDKKDYFGHELTFSSETALNMPGIWKATIGYYRQDKLIISGMFTFNVEDTGIDPGEDECAKRSELQALSRLMSNKADMTNSLFVKVWNFGTDLGDEDDMEIDASSPLSWLIADNRFINDYEGHETLYVVDSRTENEQTGKISVHYVKELGLFKHDKVDKVKTLSPHDRVYAVLRDNTETALIISDWTGTVSPSETDHIARYYMGRLITADPVNKYDAVNKNYLEGKINSEEAEIKAGTVRTNTIAKATNGSSPITVNDNVKFDGKVTVGEIDSSNSDKRISVDAVLDVNPFMDTAIRTSGKIVMDTDVDNITDAHDVTNKEYVDSKVEEDIDEAKGELNERIEDLNEKIAGKKGSYAISAADNGGISMWGSDVPVVSVNGTLHTITGEDIQAGDLKIGDNIYITETNVPDRWVGLVYENSAALYPLETSKVDISGKLDKTLEPNKVYGTDESGNQVRIDRITGIRNGSGEKALEQVPLSESGFELENDTAKAYDPNLDGTIDVQASGDESVEIGGKSAAMGKRTLSSGSETVAKGNYSHSEGRSNVALGVGSHAEGLRTVAGTGSSELDQGQYAHSEGYMTGAIGNYSHAEGNGAVASGQFAHAEGNGFADGQQAHAEGIRTTATGEGSHAEGIDTESLHPYSHAEGNGTRTNAHSSHAEGSNTETTAVFAHAEGGATKASGGYSHAEGTNTESRGTSSHAEGSYTIAQAAFSHAEGAKTKATGMYSHAEGMGSDEEITVNGPDRSRYVKVPASLATAVFTGIAQDGTVTFNPAFIGSVTSMFQSMGGEIRGFADAYSIAQEYHEGNRTVIVQNGTEYAYAVSSVSGGSVMFAPLDQTYRVMAVSGEMTVYGSISAVLGYGGEAKGTASSVHGLMNLAGYDYQAVFGTYNENKANTLFEVGNGTPEERSNGFEVYRDGHAEVRTKGQTEKSVIRKADLDERLTEIIATLQGKANTFVVSTADNPGLSSQDNMVLLSSLKDKSGMFIPLDSVHVGDVVLIEQEDVPDRWVGNVSSLSVTLYKLETRKIDLDGKLDKVTTSGLLRVYGIGGAGNQTTINTLTYNDSDGEPFHSGYIQILTNGYMYCRTPNTKFQTSNKKYVDDTVNTAKTELASKVWRG